jgi:3-hydroxyacyl-CoA dehydrogenase/enoyl-CoA hydratase/3-hydroxybutyryl-CoA epimerase
MIDLWSRYGAAAMRPTSAEARSFAACAGRQRAQPDPRVPAAGPAQGLAGKSAAALERVHVIGAGVMGGDIAAWCALRGLRSRCRIAS